jgi:hypothetical protein
MANNEALNTDTETHIKFDCSSNDILPVIHNMHPVFVREAAHLAGVFHHIKVSLALLPRIKRSVQTLRLCQCA